MIKLTHKSFFIPTFEMYFEFDNNEYKWLSIVEVYYIAKNLNIKGFKKRVFHTGITNLNNDLDLTFKSFSKTTRNEIRRAEKEGVEYIVTDNPNDDELKKYYMFYSKFCKSKNYHCVDINYLKKFNGYLTITCAKINGEILCYHLYIKDYDLKKARLLQSCSHFRLLNHDSAIFGCMGKNLIGYANKGLHYFDMQYFKKIQYNEYDRGGIYNGALDTENIKITKFKQSFSPVEIDLYNYQRMPFILEILYKIRLLLGKIF